MEARIYRAALLVACFFSLGASHRTENFMVTASTAQLSQEVAEAAENYRRELALEWLGAELPRWRDPCPITVHEGPHLGAGGATSFMFDGAGPYGWSMTIQGSRQRILDSVLPHEITHTIFATHFRRPLPRWADEGACTTVEHDSERDKQKRLLVEFLTTNRGIAFNQMFAMTEYPPDVLPLYSQGYSLVRFLIGQGGKQKFVRYVEDGMRMNNWTKATEKHYGYRSLSDLQVTWLGWVRDGSPALPTAGLASTNPPADDTTQLASTGGSSALTRTAELDGEQDDFQLAPVPLRNVRPRPERGANVTTASSQGGWYQRVRDEAQAGHAEPPPAAGAAGSQSLSRPQPVGRPEQRVLEWTAPSSGQPAARRGAPPQSYLVPRGTILR